jgi:ribosomal protein L21E
MSGKKSIRTRGKFSLSRLFQKFQDGDKVAVIIEKSKHFGFPKRLQGMTGVVEGKRGRFYVIRIKMMRKEKQFIIEPIHLKKIKQE